MAMEYLKKAGKTAAAAEQVPPVALSAYFLKGVVPEWDFKDI